MIYIQHTTTLTKQGEVNTHNTRVHLKTGVIDRPHFFLVRAIVVFKPTICNTPRKQGSRLQLVLYRQNSLSSLNQCPQTLMVYLPNALQTINDKFTLFAVAKYTYINLIQVGKELLPRFRVLKVTRPKGNAQYLFISTKQIPN